MKWSDFAASSPRLEALGRERIDAAGLILLGTLRRDGYPRISPVEPVFVAGELELGMMWQSKKARDLLRDARCIVHSVVTDRSGTEGEFKVWGRGCDVPEPVERERYCEALYEKIGWRPREPFHVFRLDVESASYRRFGDGGRVFALVWRGGGETLESEEVHSL